MSALGALKSRVLGLSPAWRSSHAALIDHLARLLPRLAFEEGDDPSVRIQGENVRLFGFRSDAEALALHAALPRDLRAAVPAPFMRLARDVLTRFIFPHMRPDLKPEGYAPAQMTGFHGQHKDAIIDLAEVGCHAELLAAFKLRPGEVFLDGGAFVGFGALALSRASPGGKVIAVEAAAPCARLLRRNILENGATEAIVPVHAALWSDTGTTSLKRDFAQAASLIDEIVPGGQAQPVATTTIDDLVTRLGLQRLDMVSLTINGAELAALDGAVETLQRLRPRLRLAGWYKIDGVSIAHAAGERLRALGYRVFVGPRGNVLALPQVRA